MPCPLHQNSPPAAPSEKGEKLVRSKGFVKGVCGRVEKGATPHVIAFANGLSLRDFWLVWGAGLEALDKEESGKDTDEREKTFAEFVHQVQLALAEARIDAEIRVHEKSPQVYLECSPASTGGNSWGRKRTEPLSEEEVFQRNPANYLRFAESCRAGPYSLDPAPRSSVKSHIPCAACEADLFEKVADDLKEILGEDAIEVEVDERGRWIEKKALVGAVREPPLREDGEITPPPLGEGGTEMARSAQSKDPGEGPLPPLRGTLSQGERGSEGKRSPFKGPGP